MEQEKKQKVSEMVVHFAGEYLALGEDIEHKQQLLNSAVSAWNIACLNEQKREKAIKKYLEGWKRHAGRSGGRYSFIDKKKTGIIS